MLFRSTALASTRVAENSVHLAGQSDDLERQMASFLGALRA